ncbi:MAG TPA: translocation/assembly module TamB domain-containing protein [Noviherbaspirillum sp.]
MDSERSPSRAGKPRRRLRASLTGLGAILLLLGAVAAWSLGTASGARAVLHTVLAMTDTGADIDGVDGRLLGPLQIRRLHMKTSDKELTLSDLRLDWHPRALLLEKTLHIESLHAARFVVLASGKKDAAPPRLPERIALPLRLRADNVELSRGEIRSGADSLIDVGGLAFALDVDASRYQLHLHRLQLGVAGASDKIGARIQGDGTLSAVTPFALKGSFSVTGSVSAGRRHADSSGTIAIGGSLADLHADLDMEINAARVTGTSRLHPFAAQALGRTQLAVAALDLSRFDPAFPRTGLEIALSVADDGRGVLHARNADAGRHDEGKLPLSSIDIAFRQQPGQWQADRIDASLGSASRPAGKLAGSARAANGTVTLSLHADDLDLRRIDGRMRMTRLTGDLRLRHASNRQDVHLALSEPAGRGRITLDADGTLADERLAVDRFLLQAGAGRIEASGEAFLADDQRFQANARVTRFRLQDLGNFPQLPQLDLNARLSLRGSRKPQLEADLGFAIRESSLGGQPLIGEGEVRVRGDQLQVPTLFLASGANRLNVEGHLSENDSLLTFELDAPALRQLGPAFGGQLRAHGSVRGNLMQPHLIARWSARQTRLPGTLQIETLQGQADVRFDRRQPGSLGNVRADFSVRGLRLGEDRLAGMTGQVRFSPQPEAPLSVQIQADGIRTGRLHATRFTASAHGSTARHDLRLALDEERQSWRARATGGLRLPGNRPQWNGHIDAFDASGRFHARLAAPASLLLSQQRVELAGFRLDSDNGRIAVEQFSRDDAGIATRGRIAHLPLASLIGASGLAGRVRTDLQLAGDWDVRISDTVSGTLALHRESGDATVLGERPLPLGLSKLNAGATIRQNRLTMQLQAEGQRLGRLEFLGGTVIGADESRMGIADDAPLSGSARVDLPSLAWLGPVLSPTTVLDGALQSEVIIGGTFRQPRLGGRITGNALRFAMAGLGIDLRQGMLDSSFEGSRLQIHRLDFRGAEGRVLLSGPVEFTGGALSAGLALRAERFALVHRADRRIVVSGDSRLEWQQQRGGLAGAFTVDAGFVDLGRADRPQLSEDVVIAGKEKKAPARTAFALDLAVSLGDGVKVVGRGLDALLGGEIRMTNDAGETLQAQGEFRVIKGTYTAYGRDLAIEQGGLRFRGPIANPALDILAMRRGQEVEAGVSVRGNVLAPRVTLVSEPSVPDAEKLSWLVLGRGLATASGEADAGALQAAAAALLSEGAKAGVQARIAGAFGLDTFSVGSSQDSLQQRIVTVGKQISSKLYVSYQQGLETAGSVIQFRYTLSPKLSVEAEAGTRSAISLFYNIAFD